MVKLLNGEIMLKQDNIEQLFSVLDESSTLYAGHTQITYLEGILKTCENVLANEILPMEDEILQKKLFNLLDNINHQEYQKEEIRKAFQLCVLKAMKLQNLSNENITPDTIGIFIAYLVEKLLPECDKLTILDPLVGTGNLLVTVANNLKLASTLVGVDNNHDSYRLARALMGMSDYNDDIYFQDTLSFENASAGLLVTDFPLEDFSENSYFPYDVLIHHHQNLKDDATVIIVVSDSFFDVSDNKNFKEDILSLYLAIGLIQLPRDIFKKQGKHILILKKKTDTTLQNENFLIAEIPSFEDREEMLKVIGRINNWFDGLVKKG